MKIPTTIVWASTQFTDRGLLFNLARRYLIKTFAELANIHTALSHPCALVIYMKV